MGSPRYSELGLSLGILEEDLRWYWKLLASISAWLLLAGFVVFPLAIDNHANNMRGGQFGLTAAATALIGVGYLVCVGFCLRWKKKHYLVDFIFIPCFGSSLIGVFNVALNILVRRLTPLTALSISVITISTVSTAVFGVAAIYNSHSVVFVPRRSAVRRGRNGEVSVDDAELQRRQLLRLYLQQGADQAPSPEVSHSTFRIDLPDAGLDADEELTVKPQRPYERPLPPSPPPGYKPGRPSNRSPPRDGNNPPATIRPHRHEPREMRRSIVELGDL
ncbi:hypothetical protein I7I51_04981 [Histoplasma capsulatum]|uniref:Uncharacterized protein n=1 Tax=Ajellomyces capsulatus TaxID=5037 RepID=A0A8A1M6B8_AJECA|nr:predicted protein [Histoplasma mississippiense (nom. inval.)]EDN09589.1 predicted protein [Histoplasma mississippiense (nom. inval.)]QSS60184.1 hypothetical protein I7I51_04981 [Histoplasma capsulatum]